MRRVSAGTVRLVRSQYHHHDLRNALVDAALAILRDEGNANFTLRDLARRVGVSHAAPYAHFADKRALLAAVATRGFEMLTRAMREAHVEGEPGTDRVADARATLSGIAVAYVLFGWRNPAHYRLMFEEPQLDDDADLPELQAASKSAYTMLDDCVRRMHGLGLLRDGDAAVDVLLVWSNSHGLASLLIDRHASLGIHTEADVIALARASAAALADGFCRPGTGVPLPSQPLAVNLGLC